MKCNFVCKSNANEVTFHGIYDKEENEVCRTCNARVERLITSTDIRGLLDRKWKVGASKRKWMNDVTEWAKSKTYGEVKRKAEEKDKWRLMVSTFVYEVDK